MRKLSSAEHAELLLLYQVTVEDMQRSKQWAWQATYATLAGEGALLGLHLALPTSVRQSAVTAFLLSIVILGLMVLGLHHVNYAERDLEHFRQRIKRVRFNFSVPLMVAFGTESPKDLWKYWFAVLGMTAVVLFSVWVVTAAM